MVMTDGALTTVSVSGIAASLAAAVFSDVTAGTAPVSAPFAGEASSAGRVPAQSTNDSAAAISLFALISFSFFFILRTPTQYCRSNKVSHRSVSENNYIIKAQKMKAVEQKNTNISLIFGIFNKKEPPKRGGS
jgi:hypothetical protein